MAKKKNDPFEKLANLTGAVAKRAFAQKALLAGEIDELRKKRIEQGASTWRILRYGRVIEQKNIPIPLAPASFCLPETFEKHLRILKEECNVVPLDDLLKAIDNYEEIPQKTVALTFDGGHMDNFLYAYPLLLKYEMPATFYVPIGFIESGGFFYEDRLAMILGILSQMNIAIPEFPFIDETIYKDMRKYAKDLAVTEETAIIFVRGLRAESIMTRHRVMHGLAKVLEEGPQPPDYEDFMRWDDLRDLVEAGFDVAMMGFGYEMAPKLSEEEFIHDILQAFEKAQTEKLPIKRHFAFPLGVYDATSMDCLEKIGVRYALGIGEIIEPRYQTRRPLLFGRLPMYEEVSFAKELFLARLWGLSIAGKQY